MDVFSSQGLPLGMPAALPGQGLELRSLARAHEGDGKEGAARDFEALLATMLVRELRQTLPNGFFGDISGADTFNGWFDELIGNEIAASGALDLAGMVKVGLEAKGGVAQ